MSLARIPSLSSFLPADNPGVSRSTMKAEMPLERAARSVTAITTRVSPMRPCVMNVFDPFSTQHAPARVAVVRMPVASLPDVDSVSAHAPSFSPRASDTSEVLFENCRIPSDRLLGDEGQGFVNTMQVLDAGRIGIAALAVGLAQGAHEAALAYAKERKAFGKTISQFQAIQWKLADAATKIEGARLLTYRAAFLRDRGAQTTMESAMAKLYASEIAVKVTDDCVQIHGGYGFVKDYPAEKYFRDVKLTTIGEGTSEIQRLVIARQLLAR